MDTIRFAATWDSKLTAITAGTMLLIAAATALVIWVAQQLDSVAATIAVSLLALPGLAVLVIAYVWSPRGYSINDRAVLIERAAGPLVIPLSSIREARPLPPGRGLCRVFGSGGLFGYFGMYRSATLGRVSLYATRSDGRVLIVAEGGPVVVTPEPASKFLEVLSERMK